MTDLIPAAEVIAVRTYGGRRATRAGMVLAARCEQGHYTIGTQHRGTA